MSVQHRVEAETWTATAGVIKHVTLTTASPTYQMKPGDTILFVVSSAADGVGIVTLPSVAEAAGKHYYIEAPTGAAGGDISLYVKETGAELTTNGDMDADNDHLILFSTGKAWLTRLDGVA
jgi:hypothetical protein